MKPLYTQEQFDNAKSKDKLPCKCYNCSQQFFTRKNLIKHELNTKKGEVKFCSKSCRINSKLQETLVFCKNCNEKFLKKNSEIRKNSFNHFCSRSCSSTYNNTHKTIGTRRSKLETYLEQQLTLLYPNLLIDFNKKNTINSELDIYIPSLKLAFELNGIYHYEPVHGQDKLTKTQNNDQRKFQACIEQGISLCIIDTSRQKYFKESTSQEFINIITDIINNKSKNLLKS